MTSRKRVKKPQPALHSVVEHQQQRQLLADLKEDSDLLDDMQSLIQDHLRQLQVEQAKFEKLINSTQMAMSGSSQRRTAPQNSELESHHEGGDSSYSDATTSKKRSFAELGTTNSFQHAVEEDVGDEDSDESEDGETENPADIIQRLKEATDQAEDDEDP